MWRSVALLWLIPAGLLAIAPADIVAPGDRISMEAFFASLITVTGFSALRLRRQCFILADESGVQLYRGRRLRKSLAWGEISKIQFGAMPMARGWKTSRLDYLVCYGRARGDAIRVVERLQYKTPPGAIRGFAVAVARLAAARQIQVSQRDAVRF